MTESTPDQEPRSIDWGLWFQWVLATTFGWIVGWALIGEAGIGAAIGVAQWFVLRSLVSGAGWWVLATTVGWAISWAAVVSGAIVPPEAGVIASLLAGALFGATVGLAQWFVLRRLVYMAGWWVPVSIVGWAFALTGILGGTVAGAVAGAATGLALDLLLRYPRAAQIEALDSNDEEGLTKYE